jgi:hypothetical protein
MPDTFDVRWEDYSPPPLSTLFYTSSLPEENCFYGRDTRGFPGSNDMKITAK